MVIKLATYQRSTELIKSRFNTINQLVDAVLTKGEPPTKPQIRSLSLYSKEIANKLQDYESNLQRVIEDLPAEEVSSETLSADQDTITGLYTDISGKIELLIPNDESTSTSQTQLETSPGNGFSRVRLPKLDLKQFSGEPLSWVSFINLFDTSIHKNSSLSYVEKFQYLLSVLSGEPLNLIKSLTLTSENYSVAYELLKERYHSPRRLITLHLNQILDLPSISAGSSKHMRAFVNVFNEHTQALKALDCDIVSKNPLLSALLLRKLDNDLRKKLECHRSSRSSSDQSTAHTLPEVQEIIQYLNEECIQVEDANLHNLPSHSKAQNASTSYSKQRPVKHFSTSNVVMVASPRPSHDTAPRQGTTGSSHSCFACDKLGHKVYSCPQFQNLSPQQRHTIVKNKQRCISCLGNHSLKQCASKATCFKCHKRHHTLLHFENEAPLSTSRNVQNKSDSEETKLVTASAQQVSPLNPKPACTVLLGTVLVKLSAANGHTHVLRALLDSGSMCDFISERAAQLLNAPRHNATHSISGISQMPSRTRGLTHLNLSSLSGRSVVTQHTFHILEKISVELPRAHISQEVVNRVKPYILADPTFHLPGTIDVLIGGAILPRIMTHEAHSLGQDMPYVIGTHFGFVVMGTAPCVTPSQQVSNLSISLLSTSDDLHASLQRFWLQEEPPTYSKKSEEEQLCDQHFDTTHSRDEDGRYVVRLPFKPNHQTLGTSQHTAKQRFDSLERKCKSNPHFKQMYSDFMGDYLSSGYMVKVDNPDLNTPHYFLPHHGVIKDSSSTTKLRTVFDASSKTSTGVSLNDTLLTGRKLQTNICDILLHFRTHNVVFSCDIRQMYSQIRVHPEDQNYQLLLWRDDPSKDIETFKMTRVVFGINSSPYLAIRTLKQLAIDEGSAFPKAADVLQTQTYVDDVISGAPTVEEALELQKQLISLLGKGGFELRKWVSNSPQLLQALPQDHLESPVFLENTHQPHFTLLGLHWSPENDSFAYHVNFPQNCVPTKRNVLSTIAKIYDPCGFLAPFIMLAKCFMQLLWTSGLKWDEPLPPELAEKWQTFIHDAKHLSSLEVPRAFQLNVSSNIELHGFCDASESGYAAVIYFRGQCTNGDIIIRQVIAKTRVAPLQRVTLPRLELCAAHLLAQMVSHCISLLSTHFTFSSTCLWCDSSVVLTWLQTAPYRLKTYVANRVSQTQELVPVHCWRHIQSAQNPADCASRGTFASELQNHPLWWNGPAWLKLQSSDWPVPQFSPVDISTSEETKKIPLIVLTTTSKNDWDLLSKFSSWTKIQYVMAYVLRFIHNCRQTAKLRGPISPRELDMSECRIIKLVQSSAFADDIRQLTNEHKSSAKLRRLNPFIDPQGILRVGGRLNKASLPSDVVHPILLPKQHHITNLVVDYYHRKHLHSGPQLTQSLICQKYWILCARGVVRSRIFKCVTCFRAKPRNNTPLMGDLPTPRVTPARPFTSTGIDYCGPFTVKVANLRAMRHVKVYICVFVCLVTKAVHLEVVTDLTTEAFIATLTRFVSRRGLCSDIYSDCGTNFIGADAAIRKVINAMVHSAEAQQKINHFAVPQRIKFHFNPPAAPHQGGLWESAVKSAKHHLRRVMGDTVLTLVDFITLVTQTEAMLNSRPLTPLSSDPSDLRALTPGHFLIGDHLTSVPQPDLKHIPINRLKQWQLVQSLHQRIWQRWQLEYLHTLQQRSKWNQATSNLKIGDLVLVHSNSAPLSWPLARITAVHPGSDGVVRVVDLKTANSQLTRPAVKVFPLPHN